MKLADIVSRKLAVTRPMVGGDPELARDIQNRLSDIGLLDPPADGKFAPASQWAVAEFLAKVGTAGNAPVDSAVARELLEADPESLWPIKPRDNLAGRLVKALQEAGHWICRHPRCVNILYVEGLDADGTPNDDAPNVFNDLRVVLRINSGGSPVIDGIWEATSEPGRFYTSVKKLNPQGAARIKFGQYKAWTVGTHMVNRPSAHEALVQVDNVEVFRDFNEDFQREGDTVFKGIFGINQHCAHDVPRSDIGSGSAGCLVGRTKSGHREFMAICKSDARYSANHGYRFMTSVLPADAIG